MKRGGENGRKGEWREKRMIRKKEKGKENQGREAPKKRHWTLWEY